MQNFKIGRNLTLEAALAAGLADLVAGFSAAFTGASFLKSFKGPDGPGERVS